MEGNAVARRAARRSTRVFALLSALLAALLLAACGDGNGGAGYGSVVVGAAWPGDVGTLAYLTGGGYQTFNTPYGVSGMRVIVKSGGTTLAVKDCPATEGTPGSCTLDKVPAGTNRVVTLQARTGGGVTIYEGTSNPFIVLANQPNSPSPATVTMTALDVATGQNDLFTLKKDGGTLNLFTEAATGVSGTPTGQDPMAAGLNWPFLSAFPLNGHLNVQLGDAWDGALDKNADGTPDPDFHKSFQLYLDVTDGQTGTFNIATYGGASFYDYTSNDTYYAGTMDGVSYAASSGTVTIVLFGANRIVGTFSLVMDSAASPGTTITLEGGFDVTRECDFWLPDILGAGGSTCPQGTPITGFPTLTGTPTPDATYVFDGEVVNVTVPYDVGGGIQMVGAGFTGGSGLDLGSNSTTSGVASPPVTVPVTIKDTNFNTGLPYPAGDYDVTLQLVKALNIVEYPVGSGKLVADPYEIAAYGVDSFYGPNFGLGQIQLLNGASPSPSISTYFAPTAIPGFTITKAPGGFPGINGSPRLVDSLGNDLVPATIQKGDPVYVDVDVTGLAYNVGVELARHIGVTYSWESFTSQNNTTGARAVMHFGPLTFPTSRAAGPWTVEVDVKDAAGMKCSAFNRSGSGPNYSLYIREQTPTDSFCATSVYLGGGSGRPQTVLTVDGPPPVVGSREPWSGASGVATSQVITVWFDADMDPATITGTSFNVKRTSDSASVAGTVAYQAGSRTATFTPTSALAASTQYTVTLETSIITDARVPANNLYGSPTALTWNFTTGP